MIKFIVDLIFPIHCLGCNQPGQFTPHQSKLGAGFICPACFSQIPLNKKSFESDFLDRLIVASHLTNPLIKNAIYRYKYDFVKDLANPLGKLMAQSLSESKPDQGILIPIPLHKKRLRWRGFNQAELLALEIGNRMNMPVNNNILIRIKSSIPQATIKSAKQRKENIKEIFQINPEFKNNLKNKTIILIDDVSTTGTTMKEAAAKLKKLQPKQIWGLVIAKE